MFPLFAARPGKQRRVTGQPDDVGVPFKPGHEYRLRKRGAEFVWHDAAVFGRVRGVFPEEYRIPRAVVVVVQRFVFDEPGGFAVKMVVAVHVFVTHFIERPTPFFVRRMLIAIEACAPYRLYIGIFPADGGQYVKKVFVIPVPPVLVAYAEDLQVERLGVSHVRPEFRPFVFGGIAVCERDQIDNVLFSPFVFGVAGRNRLGASTLTRQSRVQYRHRLRPQILAKQKVFVEAYFVRLHVNAVALGFPPQIVLRLSVLESSDRSFPVVGIFKTVAFHQTPSGETDEGGFQLLKRLDQIFSESAVAVFSAFPVPVLGRTEKKFRYVQGPFSLEADDQTPCSRFYRLYESRGLFPVFRSKVYLEGLRQRLFVVGDDRRRNASVKVGVFYIRAEFVAFVFLYSHGASGRISAAVAPEGFQGVAPVISEVLKRKFAVHAYF